MSTPAEAQLDPVMDQPQTLHPLADAGFIEQVDGALLEQAGANSLLDIFAAASLEHDGLDAGKVQQVLQHQARRARSDNADLCAPIHFNAPLSLFTFSLAREIMISLYTTVGPNT